jgi:hypothetical protein
MGILGRILAVASEVELVSCGNMPVIFSGKWREFFIELWRSPVQVSPASRQRPSLEPESPEQTLNPDCLVDAEIRVFGALTLRYI